MADAVYNAPQGDKPALPAYLARKGEGPMDDDEFRSVVQGAMQGAVAFVDTELSVERAEATKYYLGKPLGNEEEGRSQVVLTEVRDAVDGMLPSLLRIFTGPEHYVEFVPTRADTVEQAAQMTDYVRYVIEEDNDGFLQMLSVLKDGMVRKVGIFKWGWDSSTDTQSYKQEGLTRDELELLASDDDVDLVRVRLQKKGKRPPQPAPTPQPGPPPPPPLDFYDVEFTRTAKKGRARVWALPPEEFIYNRTARDVPTALLLGHRTELTRGELLAMGVSEKDIDEHAGSGSGGTTTLLTSNAEELARRDVAGVGRTAGYGFTTDAEMGTANEKILYCELEMNLDYDGDGIAELRKICTIGPTYYPIENNPTDVRHFAVFSPYPEPHTLIGGSVADRTMDIQRINSALLRGMLDSLAASIFPRTVYLEGAANVADILNTAIGAPIRERVQGAVRSFEIPFVGKEAMPVLDFMRDVVERRTGQNKGVATLDADALQSTSESGVQAALTASQAQIEMIARVFAQQALKPLFKGLAALLIEHQPRERMVRLRGQWVEVDPRQWDADMDVTVNVALGMGFAEKKVGILAAVAADQKEILMTMGMDNPLVSLPMLRNTRAKILSLQGIKDADSYYKPIDPNWQPPPPQPPPPPPEVLAMQAEHQMANEKNMRDLAIKQDELQLKKQQQIDDNAFRLLELETNAELKREATNAQFHATTGVAQMNAAIADDTKHAELVMAAHDQLHDQTLEREAQGHAQDMAERAADTADTAAQSTGGAE